MLQSLKLLIRERYTKVNESGVEISEVDLKVSR